VTIVATATGDQTVDVNPFDFYLRDPAGNRWDAFDGNAIFESTDNDLQVTTLTGGEPCEARSCSTRPPRPPSSSRRPACGRWPGC
jgi:hypothetical protein